MIRPSLRADLAQIHAVINDAASAYQGVIPADRWHEPYMPLDELEREIAAGIEFQCLVEGDVVLGVMGIQDKGEVNLIRHAYVRTAARNRGIGTQLLQHLRRSSGKPILIGTWKAATWAIAFYEKHGFTVVSDAEARRLLKQYWNVPERQVETSVVLVDDRFLRSNTA
jgi:GNAT superfamily N-acetyltransferase